LKAPFVDLRPPRVGDSGRGLQHVAQVGIERDVARGTGQVN
jgi:hypothetical protein